MAEPRPAVWTFLSNHAFVLALIAADPTLRGRDLATRIGITERGVQRIVAELAAAGYLTVARGGRRNTYAVRAELPLRHPLEAHVTVKELASLLLAT